MTTPLAPSGSTVPAYTPQTPADGQVTGTSGTEGTAKGNLDTTQTTTQQVGSGQTNTNSISNANGSPCIGRPILPFSPADLAIQLASLTSKTKDAQTTAAVNGLELTNNKMLASAKDGIQKIKDYEAATIEAAAKAKEAAEQSWFEKICNAVVGVVLVVLAAPLLMTGVGAPLFCMALGMAIDSCTACVNNSRALETPPRDPIESFGNPLNQLMELAIAGPTKDELAAAEKEVPRDEGKITALKDKLEFLLAKSELVTALMTAVTNPAAVLVNPGIVGTLVSNTMKMNLADDLAAAKASGDPAKVQEIENEILKAENIATIVTTVIVAIAGIVATVLTAGAASGLVLSSAAKIGMAAGEIAMASVNIAKSGMAIENTKLTQSAAESTRDASYAQADVAKLDAKKLMLQKFMEEGQEDVKKLVQELMEGITLVSQMINSAGNTGSAMTANLSDGKFRMA
jgi:hypothetical protein